MKEGGKRRREKEEAFVNITWGSSFVFFLFERFSHPALIICWMIFLTNKLSQAMLNSNQTCVVKEKSQTNDNILDRSKKRVSLNPILCHFNYSKILEVMFLFEWMRGSLSRTLRFLVAWKFLAGDHPSKTSLIRIKHNLNRSHYKIFH